MHTSITDDAARILEYCELSNRMKGPYKSITQKSLGS